MNLFRKLTLFLDFYGFFAVATLLITFVCVVLLYQLGMGAFVYLFWFKVITLGLCVYTVLRSQKKKFYYFRNLGFSIGYLWKGAMLFDFLIFILFMSLVIQAL